MDRQRHLEILDRFRSSRVGVVGDFLLDQYVIGTSARVSREAPIVVVDYQDTVYHPGGAANAAQNVTAFGGAAHAVGVLGDDREAGVLWTLLEARGVTTTGLVREPEAMTSTKLRILAGEMNAQKQQVARVDRSHRVVFHASLSERVRGLIDEAVEECDVVLLADYGLGVLSPDMAAHVLARCAALQRPVVVDSRHRLREFQGATVATPNEVEAMEALGVRSESELTDRASLARRIADTGIRNLIVTRGSKGMVVCGADAPFTALGIAGSHEATDVTGAGDTVSAVVALSLAAGATLVEAAQMATFAASVVVMKRGTATASPDEVRDAIERAAIEKEARVMRASSAPIFDDVAALRAHIDADTPRRVVLANGCFDPLHVGHVRYLEDARRHGDFLVVALNNNDSTRRLKGSGRPVVDEAARAALLTAVDGVDAVLLFADDNVERILETLRPAVHAKGTDYTAETVPEADVARRLGIVTVITGDPKAHASREIVARIRSSAGETTSS